jgi:hypothetical protein
MTTLIMLGFAQSQIDPCEGFKGAQKGADFANPSKGTLSGLQGLKSKQEKTTRRWL